MSNGLVLDKLNSFIDTESPHMARFLYRMWRDQQDAITYKELREAILNGVLDISMLLDWQQDYSNFLAESYAPLAQKAIVTATKDLNAIYGVNLKDPVRGAMDKYISIHGGRLIREITEKQYKAINTLVRQAAMTDTITVDQLARAIRPCIGLTENQVAQTKCLYDQLRENGVPHKTALQKQMVFAAKKHRERAASIAQTELAYAYNSATQISIENAIRSGNISDESDKYWKTAKDETVCKKCNAVAGERVKVSESFSNGLFLPPAHPRCRCAVGYHLTKPKHKRPANNL